LLIFRLCGWYYADEKALVKPIWEETLQELSFIGPQGIIASMQ